MNICGERDVEPSLSACLVLWVYLVCVCDGLEPDYELPRCFSCVHSLLQDSQSSGLEFGEKVAATGWMNEVCKRRPLSSASTSSRLSHVRLSGRGLFFQTTLGVADFHHSTISTIVLGNLRKYKFLKTHRRVLSYIKPDSKVTTSTPWDRHVSGEMGKRPTIHPFYLYFRYSVKSTGSLSRRGSSG